MGGIFVEFRRYRRRFRRPLRTAWGEWGTREGIVVRLETEAGLAGFGEVAPPPWPAIEPIEEAAAFLDRIAGRWTGPETAMEGAPPGCRFALESAVAQVESRPTEWAFPVAALLPAGAESLGVFDERWQAGFRTFKWKMGVESIEREMELFRELVARKSGACFRLDANGGMRAEEARRWLAILPVGRVEFFEQPLPVGEEREMAALAAEYDVPIALDESATTLADVQRLQESQWPGLLVIKPSWLGEYFGAIEVLRHLRSGTVFSSALETAVGEENALRLAASIGEPERAIGFGVGGWFEEDGLTASPSEPTLRSGAHSTGFFEELWRRL